MALRIIPRHEWGAKHANGAGTLGSLADGNFLVLVLPDRS